MHLKFWKLTPFRTFCHERNSFMAMTWVSELKTVGVENRGTTIWDQVSFVLVASTSWESWIQSLRDGELVVPPGNSTKTKTKAPNWKGSRYICIYIFPQTHFYVFTVGVNLHLLNQQWSWVCCFQLLWWWSGYVNNAFFGHLQPCMQHAYQVSKLNLFTIDLQVVSYTSFSRWALERKVLYIIPCCRLFS